jgi:hypothetical protein
MQLINPEEDQRDWGGHRAREIGRLCDSIAQLERELRGLRELADDGTDGEDESPARNDLYRRMEIKRQVPVLNFGTLSTIC